MSKARSPELVTEIPVVLIRLRSCSWDSVFLGFKSQYGIDALGYLLEKGS